MGHLSQQPAGVRAIDADTVGHKDRRRLPGLHQAHRLHGRKESPWIQGGRHDHVSVEQAWCTGSVVPDDHVDAIQPAWQCRHDEERWAPAGRLRLGSPTETPTILTIPVEVDNEHAVAALGKAGCGGDAHRAAAAAPLALTT